MDSKTREVSMREWEKWRELCDKLGQLGAVTPADLNSLTSANGTPGQKLLICIREWGELMAEVAVIEARERK
jgi:hypothetical protein